jgi:predicted ArsR family transcriptional regulator
MGELRRGPSYGAELESRLGATSGAVHGALKSLERRELIKVVGTQPTGHGLPRIVYALADADVVWSPPPRPERAHDPVDDPDLLGRELEQLREAYGGVEFEALMAGNRGLGSW